MRDKDWVQIGNSHHSAGKSHVAKCGGYPIWGDNGDDSFEWNQYVLVYINKEFNSQ